MLNKYCKCGNYCREGQRTCLRCHAAYLRKWRRTHSLNQEQRMKSNCRCYARIYQKRGKIISKPCEKCGSLNPQRHHEDYNKPLDIVFLCRECHLEYHKKLKSKRITNIKEKH